MKRIALLFGSVILAAAPTAAQEKFNLTLAGASPGGFWSLIHAGVNKAVSAQFPGSVITYRTSGGGFANIPLVSEKRVDIGLAHDGELKPAIEGTAPFKRPIRNLRVIVVVYDNVAACQFIMAKAFADKHGIARVEDIAKKKPPMRIAFNRRGNVVHALCVELFRELGIALDDFKKWGGGVEMAGSAAAFELLSDGRVDAVAGGDGAVPGRRIIQVSKTKDIVLLPIAKDVVERVGKRTGTRADIIKGGTYAFQPKDVSTLWLAAAILAHENMSDKTAYNLAKAMIEKIDQFKSVHRAFKGYTPRTLTAKFLVPYHPGAARYYKEKGLQ